MQKTLQIQKLYRNSNSSSVRLIYITNQLTLLY